MRPVILGRKNESETRDRVRTWDKGVMDEEGVLRPKTLVSSKGRSVLHYWLSQLLTRDCCQERTRMIIEIQGEEAVVAIEELLALDGVEGL